MDHRDIAKAYTNPKSSSYYQSATGLHTSLRDQFGKESPSLKNVKKFLRSQKSSYLQTPRHSAEHKLRLGQSARWVFRNSVGVLSMDCAYVSR